MLIRTSLISPEVYEQDFIVRLLTTTGTKIRCPNTRMGLKGAILIQRLKVSHRVREGYPEK